MRANHLLSYLAYLLDYRSYRIDLVNLPTYSLLMGNQLLAWLLLLKMSCQTWKQNIAFLLLTPNSFSSRGFVENNLSVHLLQALTLYLRKPSSLPLLSMAHVKTLWERLLARFMLVAATFLLAPSLMVILLAWISHVRQLHLFWLSGQRIKQPDIYDWRLCTTGDYIETCWSSFWYISESLYAL